MVFAVLLLRRPRTGHRCARASPLRRRRSMTSMEPLDVPLGMHSVLAAVDRRVPVLPDRRRRRLAPSPDASTARSPRCSPAWSPVPSSGPDRRWPAAAGSDPVPWILATAVGMGAGLLLGATVVGFRTSLADVALMGALTGCVLGLAQTVALPAADARAGGGPWRCRCSGRSAGPSPPWSGSTVEEQFTIFGASGAVTFSALSGILLHRCCRSAPPATVAADPATAAMEDTHDQHTAPRHLRHRRDRPRHPATPCSAAARRCGWSTAPAPPGYRTTSRWSPATPPTRPSPPTSPAAPAVVYQTLNPPYARWVRGVPRPCRPACSPPPRPTGPGWSAWRTSTCTAARPAGR